MGINSAGPQVPRAAAVKETGAVKFNRSPRVRMRQRMPTNGEVQQVTPK